MGLIENTTNKILLSSMSIVELMIKKSIGKLDFNLDNQAMAENMGIEILIFNGFDALQLKTFPLLHKDPFDCIIFSQAQDNEFSVFFMIVNFLNMVARFFRKLLTFLTSREKQTKWTKQW